MVPTSAAMRHTYLSCDCTNQCSNETHLDPRAPCACGAFEATSLRAKGLQTRSSYSLAADCANRFRCTAVVRAILVSNSFDECFFSTCTTQFPFPACSIHPQWLDCRWPNKRAKPCIDCTVSLLHSAPAHTPLSHHVVCVNICCHHMVCTPVKEYMKLSRSHHIRAYCTAISNVVPPHSLVFWAEHLGGAQALPATIAARIPVTDVYPNVWIPDTRTCPCSLHKSCITQ